MIIYFVEEENKRVRITSNKYEFVINPPFPLRSRAFVSVPFQLSMIEAYIQEKWTIIMDDNIKTFWENRPEEFDTRHNK